MSSPPLPPPTGAHPPPSTGAPPPAGAPPPPTGAPSPPPPPPSPTDTSTANYFFGFVITFVVLLLLFVACGIGSWRRFRLTGTAWDERLQDMEGSSFVRRKRGRRRLIRPVFWEAWSCPEELTPLAPALSEKGKWVGTQVSPLLPSLFFHVYFACFGVPWAPSLTHVSCPLM